MIAREKTNILLVDDQPAKLLSLEAILSDLGENLIKAESADEALKHLLSKDIAVVLVDVCMPRMDGFELAELIRGHPRFQRTAIIFASAVHMTDADRLRGYDLGAVDYIHVPIIPQVLRAKVAVFAELYRKTNELERLNAELQERVAELDRSYEHLRFTDRMATIGTLAAGLGHDMGNLLLPVRMRLDSIENCELPSSARDDVAAIRKGVEYLRRLAISLRLLSIDPENLGGGDSATNIAQWWEETEGMIRNGIPRSVTLTAEIPPDLPPLKIDKAALTQIVFNLVQNAGDALKGRTDGKVIVSVFPAPSDHALILSVSDNGPGMTPEARQRCLEPFFTTKTRARGTGLGLALVAGLVKRAEGSVQIESTPGQGATFRLHLPTTPRAQSGSGTPPPRPQVAVVNVLNDRLSAHVISVLNSLEFQVRGGEPSGADLWVTDSSGSLADVQRFAETSPGSRAIVFSPPDEPRQSSDRVMHLEPEMRPSVLRSRLRSWLAGHAEPTGARA